MGLAVVTVIAGVVMTVSMVGLVAVRRRLRGAPDRAEVASAQRRFLVSNWSEVEQAAVRGGMSSEEIADVRRRLFEH